jgi:hypothetical protein
MIIDTWHRESFLAQHRRQCSHFGTPCSHYIRLDPEHSRELSRLPAMNTNIIHLRRDPLRSNEPARCKLVVYGAKDARMQVAQAFAKLVYSMAAWKEGGKEKVARRSDCVETALAPPSARVQRVR